MNKPAQTYHLVASKNPERPWRIERRRQRTVKVPTVETVYRFSDKDLSLAEQILANLRASAP